MKINYERTVPILPTLDEVRPGELFRLLNHDKVYLRTQSYGCDDFTSDKAQGLRRLCAKEQFEFIAEDDMEYEDLVFCVDVEAGKLVLLNHNLNVEKLIGELLIKERSFEI